MARNHLAAEWGVFRAGGSAAGQANWRPDGGDTRVAGDARYGAAFWKLAPCRRMIKYEALE